jgi:hypothetical protein
MASERLGAFASHLAEPLTNDDKKPVCILHLLLCLWQQIILGKEGVKCPVVLNFKKTILHDDTHYEN